MIRPNTTIYPRLVMQLGLLAGLTGCLLPGCALVSTRPASYRIAAPQKPDRAFSRVEHRLRSLSFGIRIQDRDAGIIEASRTALASAIQGHGEILKEKDVLHIALSKDTKSAGTILRVKAFTLSTRLRPPAGPSSPPLRIRPSSAVRRAASEILHLFDSR